jgi:hypothetical protein
MGSPDAQCLSAATRLIGDPVTIGEVFEFSMAGSTTLFEYDFALIEVPVPASARSI